MDTSQRKFKNSWSRIERAAHHLAAFHAEWKRLAQDRFGQHVQGDRDSGWYIASLTADDAVKNARRNTTLPLILGEYAYQLRAALDGLIWDASTFAQGSEPPADANRLEFPILNGQVRDFKKCGFLKFPFPDKLKTWLESIQPGSAEKPLGHPDRGLAGALEDVHNLARLDRHRRLRMIASYPTEIYPNFVFDPPTGFKAVDIEGLPCNTLGDEYDLLKFRVESATGHRPRKIRIEIGAKFEVFFEDLAPYNDVPPGERLVNLAAAIEYVIFRFEEEFAA